MRARSDRERRVAALEARRRPPAPPVDQDAARFEAMTDQELDAWLADPPPLADDAEPIPDFDAMSDHELDDFLADQWTNPEQENRRGAAGRG